MAISETPLIDAARLAIEEVNQSGGVRGRPLEALIVDIRSDPAVAAAAAERMITEEGVVSLFGCWTSDCRKALLPVLQRHSGLLWYPVQYEGQENSANVIYTGAAPNQQIVPAVDWAIQSFGRRIFLVGSDYVFPRTANLIIRDRAFRRGATIVGESYLPLGSTDVGAVVQAVVQARPDLIINTINGDTNVHFFFELARATTGSRLPLLSFSIAEGEIRTIGTHHLQGSYVAWNYFQSLDSPLNRAFVAAFRQSSGPSAVTSDPIEAAYFQIHAFAEAASNASNLRPMAIRDAALGLTMVAPGGLVRIDERWQHTWKTVRVGEIMPDGQIREEIQSIVPIAPTPFAGGGATSSPLVQVEEQPSVGQADVSGLLRDSAHVAEAALLIRAIAETSWSADDRLEVLLSAARSPSFVLRHESYRAAALAPAYRTRVAETLLGVGEPFDLVMAMRLLSGEDVTLPALADAASRLLDHPDRQVRLEAVRALLGQALTGWRADDAATSRIAARLQDTDLGVRRDAISLSLYSTQLESRVLPMLSEEDFAAAPAFFRPALCEAAAGVVSGATSTVRTAGATPLLERLVVRLDRGDCLAPAELAALRASVARVQATQPGGFLRWYGAQWSENVVSAIAVTLAILIAGFQLLAFAVALGVLAIRPARLLDGLRRVTWLDGAHRFRLWGLEVNVFSALSPTWLTGSRRAQRAWIQENLDAYREAFERRPTVSARRKHVLLPALIGDEPAPAEPTPDVLRRRLHGDRLKVQIVGEGGTGKTSLACQIARWSMSHNDSEQLGARRAAGREAMIAVFFEPGLPVGATVAAVLQSIQRQLTIDSRPVPLWMVRRLIDGGHVVTVLDDVLEIDDLLPEVFASIELRALRLVATSRTELPPGSGDWSVIRPLKLHGHVLTEFFVNYAKISGQIDTLGDDDIESFVTQFKSLLGPEETRQETVVYFARLFLDYVFDQRRQSAGFDDALSREVFHRPRSVPELVESFVESTCRHAAARHGLSRVEVAGMVRELAYGAILPRCRPGPFPVSTLATLRHSSRSNVWRSISIEELLLDSGLVDQSPPLFLKFKVDLIQEYAAVLHVRDQATGCGTTIELYTIWKDWVDRILATLDGDSRTSGLLKATYDCLRSDRVAADVPDDLLRLVADKLGLDERDLQPIRIGILHSLQGTMAMSETPLRDAALLAVEEINRAGGIAGRRLEAVVRDGASDPAIFAQQARRLIREDGVSSIFGCWTSATRMAVRPVVEDERSLLWYPVQYEGYEQSDAIIYTGAAPNQQILPAVDWCLNSLLPGRGVEKGAARLFLVGSDYVFPRRANAIIRRRLSEDGVAPAGERYVPLGETDFGHVVEEMTRVEPHAVINTVNGSSNIGFFRALTAAGLTATELPVVSLSIAEAEVRDIGVSRMKGHFAVWNYFQSLPPETNTRFVESFQREYGLGRVTSDPIATAYIQIVLFAEAAKRARPLMREEILATLATIEIDTPAGRIRMDPATNHFYKYVYVGQINEEGQFDVIDDEGPREPVRPVPFPYPDLTPVFAEAGV